jgi:N-acetyl sugar amidotransferase
MQKVYRCKKCIMPNTKPDLYFVNGICTGCLAYEGRSKINYKKREKEFKKLISYYKNNKKNAYDCIVPVSGGKDSFFQTLKCLEYKLKPLCVVASTQKLSTIGRHNIEALKNLGVDVIEFSPNKQVRRKIDKFTLQTIGDISWSEHMCIWSIPFRIAQKFQIKLIIWGENSQNENGGPLESQKTKSLNERWITEFGGLGGLRATDLIEPLNLSIEDIYPYTISDQFSLPKDFKSIFLGQYFPWYGIDNYKLAKKNGFKEYHKNVEGSCVSFENLDNLYMRIHDYFKFLKYGYDRTTDWLCWKIRRNEISRIQSIKTNSRLSGLYPDEYLGEKLKILLKDIDVSLKEFNTICDNYVNRNIFIKDKKNSLIKDKKNRYILNEHNF